MENEIIIDFLQKNDQSFKIEENIYYAEKAFVVKSVVNWCVEQREMGLVGEKEVNNYLELIKQYLDGKIIIFWSEKDHPMFTKVAERGLNE